MAEDGKKPWGAYSRRKQYRVLLGYSHVVISVRHRLFQNLKSGAAGHRRGDADHGTVLLAKPHHGLAEDVLPGRRGPRFGRGRGAGLNIVGTGAVEFFRLLQGHVVASALLRQNVGDDWFVAGLGKFQGADQQRGVVPVNRPKITQSHLLNDQTASVTAAPVRLRTG